MKCQRYSSPCGELLLGVHAGCLVCCDWLDPWRAEQGEDTLEDALRQPVSGEEEALLAEAVCQLDAYFRGERQSFDLPLAPAGTPFQEELWQALAGIPYGETRTYGHLAELIGRPKAFQAVGSATGANPLAILIPCHRVVGKRGSFSGYRGGREAKEYLLALEAEVVMSLTSP